MATGGFASPSPAAEDDVDSLSCALCLEIFTSPKILPCAHTYCEKCLGHLVESTQRDTFPCPSCREVIKVPHAGVSAFKANFYIKAEDLDKARKGLFCKVHPGRELELYCSRCHLCICFECKYDDHETHTTESLPRAKAQLSKDKVRLNDAVLSTKNTVNKVIEDRKALKKKKTVIERYIHTRHNALVETASIIRDKELASLTTVTDGMDTRMASKLWSAQGGLTQLLKMQQQLEDSQNSSSAKDVVKLTRMMRDGPGSEAAVKNLTAQPFSAISRPVLCYRQSAKEIVQSIQDYMGHAIQADMDPVEPEVEVKEHIHRDDLFDSEVVSLCPKDSNSVFICYEASGIYFEQFKEEGRMEFIERPFTGRIDFKLYNAASGHFFCEEPRERYLISYVKSSKLIHLKDYLKGSIKVKRINIIREEPLKTEVKTEFTIHCGKHRACDIDDKEEFVAVVEEALPPDTQRKVLLFQRPNPSPVDAYSTQEISTRHASTPTRTRTPTLTHTTLAHSVPVPAELWFQPTDVCFYKLGGQEVLLVSDAARDAIHVLHVQEGKLRFLRYLAPGCPLLLQPSALNVDSKGRLWVACRGGSILVCTPLE
ncbi:uncharacterized protein [Littorina saxatilis]|uniref:Uncharacterized protein n=1 Tax=Littorina saxatilis TaxID=31220 RepID=A0AAN9AUU4_9CAEN